MRCTGRLAERRVELLHRLGFFFSICIIEQTVFANLMEHRAITCAASKTMHVWWQRMFTCEFVGASTCPRVFFCNGWMCTFCNNETGSHFAQPGCVDVCECEGGCAQQHMGVWMRQWLKVAQKRLIRLFFLKGKDGAVGWRLCDCLSVYVCVFACVRVCDLTPTHAQARPPSVHWLC